VACRLMETEIVYLRAWPVLLGISMALGEIPQQFFEAILENTDLAKLQYELYRARSEFYK
jgi:hypothetical protein